MLGWSDGWSPWPWTMADLWHKHRLPSSPINLPASQPQLSLSIALCRLQHPYRYFWSIQTIFCCFAAFINTCWLPLRITWSLPHFLHTLQFTPFTRKNGSWLRGIIQVQRPINERRERINVEAINNAFWYQRCNRNGVQGDRVINVISCLISR